MCPIGSTPNCIPESCHQETLDSNFILCSQIEGYKTIIRQFLAVLLMNALVNPELLISINLFLTCSIAWAASCAMKGSSA
jgi:hypothetical protein